MATWRDCDYIRTKDGLILIVSGDYHPEGRVRAVPVFWPSPNGDRISEEGIKYVKYINPVEFSYVSAQYPELVFQDPKTGDKFIAVPEGEIVRHYKPRDGFKDSAVKKENSDAAWLAVADAIIDVAGVRRKEIGIFGSSLVGLTNKNSDADIVVYGGKNLKRVTESFGKILDRRRLRPPSPAHLQKLVDSHAKVHQISAEDLLEHKKRQWHRVRHKNTVVDIAFAYDDNEIPPNPITSPPIGEIGFTAKVANAVGSHFLPRLIKVEKDEDIIDVVTHFWIFQSCVREGETVRVIGNLRTDGGRVYVTLDKPHHNIAPLR